MKRILEKFVISFCKKWNLTPNMLSYIRIFSAPWLAFLISQSLLTKNILFVIITLIFYLKIIMTDVYDGILARHLVSKNQSHDKTLGGMLDRLADKILIIFLLIPFGLNLLTVLIIGGESILAYQAIFASHHKKSATKAGKLKMLFQTFLIPILLLSRTTSLIPDMFLFAFIILTISLTYNSIYSHYIADE